MGRKKEELEPIPPAMLTSKQTNEVPAEWMMRTAGKKAVRLANAELNKIGRNAMIASIPMICRGLDICPFSESCTVEAMSDEEISPNELIGQKCPLEVAEIMALMDIYSRVFGLESMEDQGDVVKMSLIRELVDCDIQIRRAERRMSQEGDFLEEVAIGYNESAGEPIMQRQVSKPVEYKDKVTEKRHKILGLLNSTPKDKAAEELKRAKLLEKEKKNDDMDASTWAAKIFASIQEKPELLDKLSAIDLDVIQQVREDDSL